jgi:hypothetical protein
MEKHKIIVPKDIRYVGQENPETNERIWLDYNLNLYDFPHILNKKLTGCGFTEYCIKNKQKLILISPRKFLLENKEDQHEGEVYYVKNEIETSVDFELDLNQDDLKAIDERKKTTDASENITIENLDRLKRDLRNAMRLWEAKYGKDNPEHPFKILVTYDSFRHVKDALKHFYWDEGNHLGNYDDRFDEFQVVVDEFQSIFIDSRFKSDTEIELLSNLKNVKKVCFVSATPMLDKYLERLDEFKSLPYYEFDWETEDPSRVKKPKLEIRFVTSSLNQAVNGVIQGYKDGRFDTRIDPKTGKFIESKEATLFLNSVAGICQAIRSNKLHLSECNVLCAQTTKNKEAVRRAFNDVLKKEAESRGEKTYDSIKKDIPVIGKIPTRGQQHKMFTFCTRTVYLGADFYSTNARTFIFSDSNIQCLAVDISMDLEQIIGRQRLAENPWKNTALMYVKTTNLSRKTTQEEFNELLNEKTKSTEKLLDTFKDAKEDNKWDLAKKYQRDAKVSHYRYDYVAVSRIENSKGQVVRLQPTFNQLVLITEQRAFELQQSDYADRFSVFSSVQSESMDSIENEVSQKVEEFNEIKRVNDKIRFLVEYSEKAEKKNFDNLLELIPGKYKDYFQIVGLDIIKAYGCEEYKIKKAWTEKIMNQEVKDDVDLEIYGSFTIGKRYSNKHVKDILNELYQKLGYKKKAKTTDLEVYYAMKAVKFQDTDGKWINGLEIIGKR